MKKILLFAVALVGLSTWTFGQDETPLNFDHLEVVDSSLDIHTGDHRVIVTAPGYAHLVNTPLRMTGKASFVLLESEEGKRFMGVKMTIKSRYMRSELKGATAVFEFADTTLSNEVAVGGYEANRETSYEKGRTYRWMINTDCVIQDPETLNMLKEKELVGLTLTRGNEIIEFKASSPSLLQEQILMAETLIGEALEIELPEEELTEIGE